VVERNLCLLEGLGVPIPRERVFGGIALKEEEKRAARGFFEAWGVEPGREVVALNPGAGWESKRWPWGHFARLGERLWSDGNLKSLVLWGPKEEVLRDAILRELKERGVEARAAPPTGLRELAALVREVALFVGGDTGPTHLAAIQGVPTLGVFGGSDAVRNGPWGPRVRTLQTTTLPCVPCWKQKCLLPRENPEVIPCLERVTPEQVAEAGLTLLEDGGRGDRKGG
jgi:ADP-heptose:LPS heptosyltransferase